MNKTLACSLQGITGYRAARQGEPENQNFGFSGFVITQRSHILKIKIHNFVC
jgi:hypothetical protein